MKQTITKSDFVQAFSTMNRADNFSRQGREALFDYLEQLEQDTGTEIEFDVIALCCDFSEASIDEVLRDYDLESLDDLRDRTTVIEVDDETIIYQAF